MKLNSAKHFLVLTGTLLALSVEGWAQKAGTVGPSPGLSTDDVVAMVKAGLSEDVIIVALRKEDRAFDLSALELVTLKQSGVPDNVLKVMMDPDTVLPGPATASPPTSAPAAPSQPGAAPVATPVGVMPLIAPIGSNPSGATPAPGTVVAADVNDPDAPHDSGIYLYTEENNVRKMTVIERAAYQGGKSGGMLGFALTAGIKKAKWKAVLPGQSASIRTTDSRPVFYFYFDDKAAGLGKSYFGMQNISNPNQFALIKLTLKSRNRETIVGELGTFGASSGTHEKSMRGFKSERLRPGLYRVTPNEPLEPGEYCFLASQMGGAGVGPMGGGASSASDIFDFSVLPAE